MKKPQINKKALRRATWSAISRVIGICLGAGAGSLLYHIIGPGLPGLAIALVMCVISFLLMLFVEYEREKDT